MGTIQENWDLFCSKLEKVKPTRNGIEALCPAHDDKKASLTASHTSDTILFNCQAGCSFDVNDSIDPNGARGIWTIGSDGKWPRLAVVRPKLEWDIKFHPF